MAFPKLLQKLFQNSGAGSLLREDIIPVDSSLSTTSTNAVQNKVVKSAVDTLTTSVNAKLPLSGGNITGSLSIGGVEVVPVANNAAAHNAIYRGIDLTTKYTEAQISAKIQAGDFSDLFIGDYIPKTLTIDGTTITSNWTIAHFDYWMRMGSSDMTSHHVVLVPHNYLYGAKMNSTNTTEGGFKGSAMYTTELPKVATALKTAFGSSHVLSFSCLVSNKMTASLSSMCGGGTTGAVPTWAWEWATLDCSLMSEPMVYGTAVWTSSNADIGCCKSRLALFTLNPASMNVRANWWLSSVASSTFFAYVANGGYANAHGASNSRGVRPFFLYH